MMERFKKKMGTIEFKNGEQEAILELIRADKDLNDQIQIFKQIQTAQGQMVNKLLSMVKTLEENK